jgi:hypothetical protein
MTKMGMSLKKANEEKGRQATDILPAKAKWDSTNLKPEYDKRIQTVKVPVKKAHIEPRE